MESLCKKRRSRWRKRFIVQQQSTESHSEDINFDYMSPFYQFLELSPISTFYFQPSLPRIQIPSLKSTCAQYLDSVLPILTTNQYLKTKGIVENFKGKDGIGQKLDKELLKLEKKAKGKRTSYISGPWFQMYLSKRKSLPINSNPTIVFNKIERIMAIQDMRRRQLVLATNLLISTLRFLRSLESQTLSPDVYPDKTNTPSYGNRMKLVPYPMATRMSVQCFDAYPLDMSSYNSLFSSTRIPQIGGDKILKQNDRAASSHIVVMRNGFFYSVRVLDVLRNILPVGRLMGSLAYIQEQDEGHGACAYPIGFLTSLDRDKWAMTRTHLVKSGLANKICVDKIDSALFLLCLDDQILAGKSEEGLIQHFLHSDGTNRWFDKSFQLIVTKDGWAGITYEYAWGHGVPIEKFMDKIFKDSVKHEWSNSIEAEIPKLLPSKLEFEMEDLIKEGIEDARATLNTQISILKINILKFHKYGKIQCKEWRIDPDSIAQLCFQVAFYRMYDHAPPTSESYSTCGFKHGRTQTIRPSTSLTLEISQIMSQESWTRRKYELKELIIKSSQKHEQLCKDAFKGHGFDRHLYALKFLAKERKEGLVELFNDVAYSRINRNVLSTLSLTSSAIKFGGFGPAVIDGFGINYQLLEDGFELVVSSYEDHRNGLEFINQCNQVFLDLQAILSIEIAKW